ncbi:unnamed protein product [Periconia digitata]|uniref:Uncharacterized protein n=1 Tax=Periconia digitata TaxID=1303443 RepID=A0A9W4XHL3_9PLEO|nr:unnamed protein product [Periconia digitata]
MHIEYAHTIYPGAWTFIQKAWQVTIRVSAYCQSLGSMQRGPFPGLPDHPDFHVSPALLSSQPNDSKNHYRLHSALFALSRDA